MDKEIGPEELEEILSKLKDSMQSDIRQTVLWNTLGLLLLKTGRLQVRYVIVDLFHISCSDIDFIMLSRVLYQFCHLYWLWTPITMTALVTLGSLTFKGIQLIVSVTTSKVCTVVKTFSLY